MYKHILLAHDGSELSAAALKQAIQVAEALGAKLTAIHVVPPFHLSFRTLSTPSSVRDRIEGDHDAEALDAARKMLSAAQAEAKAQGVDCATVAILGDHPYQGIIDQATKSGCDVIMMASHGRRGLEGLLLGSETVKVLTHSRIPVLVVR